DVDVIRQQPYVYAASAEIENGARLRRGNLDSAARVTGIGPDFFTCLLYTFQKKKDLTFERPFISFAVFYFPTPSQHTYNVARQQHVVSIL
ncbi:hypothetical protein, partial [Citrobacter cronae]|uniref:hypothetical protein n=1 Tax=Citrobacter cronae TaxID=1748967 RepID=UPI00387EC3F6